MDFSALELKFVRFCKQLILCIVLFAFVSVFIISGLEYICLTVTFSDIKQNACLKKFHFKNTRESGKNAWSVINPVNWTIRLIRALLEIGLFEKKNGRLAIMHHMCIPTSFYFLAEIYSISIKQLKYIQII